MQPFIYFFLFPLLAIITAVFALIAFKHWKHEQIEAERHIEKTEQLNNIKSNVTALSSKIDDKVVPTVNNIYDAVTNIRPKLTAANVKECILAMLGGTERVLIVTENPLFIIFGRLYEEDKISFLLKYDPVSNDMIVRSFAYRLPVITLETVNRIFSYNALAKVGGLYIQTFADVNILFNKYTIHSPTDTLTSDVMDEILRRLSELQYDFIKELRENQINFSPILMEEYVPLYNAEVDKMKLVEEKQQIENSKTQPQLSDQSN